MTKRMTDPAMYLAPAPAWCTARTVRARTAVHRCAMPGLGFRPVHGLLGIFRKSYKSSQEVEHLASSTPAEKTRNFLQNVRASVHFAETQTGQGIPVNGSANSTRGSVRGHASNGCLQRGQPVGPLAGAEMALASGKAGTPNVAPGASLRDLLARSVAEAQAVGNGTATNYINYMEQRDED